MRYFDTSALVKQYLEEVGSKAVLQLLKTGDRVYTASLTYAETHAAFSRRTREGRLKRETTRRLALRQGLGKLRYRANDDVLSLARQALYRYPLRSADAIHLASALFLARTAPTDGWAFVCADRRLCDAAEGEGFESIYAGAD